ncbi:MAG: hypothetical protein P8J45_03405 [Phycisphaerales bacterium]|jgi:hypothetical protein|nr:hypothetical protein [Phycisphaerales bacterium]
MNRLALEEFGDLIPARVPRSHQLSFTSPMPATQRLLRGSPGQLVVLATEAEGPTVGGLENHSPAAVPVNQENN